MKYNIVTVVNKTVSPVLTDNDEPLVLSISNSFSLGKGDELQVGSALFVVLKRRFNISSLGKGTLYVKYLGTVLDVHNGVLGVTGKF